jgi:hypothetical protein
MQMCMSGELRGCVDCILRRSWDLLIKLLHHFLLFGACFSYACMFVERPCVVVSDRWNSPRPHPHPNDSSICLERALRVFCLLCCQRGFSLLWRPLTPKRNPCGLVYSLLVALHLFADNPTSSLVGVCRILHQDERSSCAGCASLSNERVTLKSSLNNATQITSMRSPTLPTAARHLCGPVPTMTTSSPGQQLPQPRCLAR